MSNPIGHFTHEQLEQGMVVDCRDCDDPGLAELRAMRIKLQASPGFPGRLQAAEKLGDIEVLAQLPGREGWLRAGSLRGRFRTAWRAVDALLIEDFVERLARALGLAVAAGSSERRRRERRVGT